jgi:hypothetical protein
LLWGKHDYISHPDEHTNSTDHRASVAQQSLLHSARQHQPFHVVSRNVGYGAKSTGGGEYNPKVGEEMLKWMQSIH